MTTQNLWRAIHVYPRVRGTEGFDTLLRAVRRLLPCSCCRDHMDTYIAKAPPDASSPDALFVWGWAFHQAVNAKLGRRGIELDEARRIWRPQG